MLNAEERKHDTDPARTQKKILTALKEEQICRLPVTKARFHCGLNCFADKKGRIVAVEMLWLAISQRQPFEMRPMP